MSPWDRSLMGDPATDLAVTLARWRGRLRIGTASASMLLLVGTGAFAIVASAPPAPSFRDPLVMDLADGAVKQGPAASGGSGAIAAGGGPGAVSGGSAGEGATALDSILDRLRALGEDLGLGLDRGLAAGDPNGRDDQDVAVTDPATEPTDEASGSGSVVDDPASTPEGPIEEPSPQPPTTDPSAPIEDPSPEPPDTPSPQPPTDDRTQGPPDGRSPGPQDGRRPVDPPTTGPPADPPSADPPRGRPTDGPPASPPSDEPPVDPPSRRPTERDDRRGPSDPSPSSTRSSPAATPARPSISPSPSRAASPTPSASPTRSSSPSPRATRPASGPPRVDDAAVEPVDDWCADKPGRGPRDNPASSSGNPGRGAENGHGKHERVCTTDTGRGGGPK